MSLVGYSKLQQTNLLLPRLLRLPPSSHPILHLLHAAERFSHHVLSRTGTEEMCDEECRAAPQTANGCSVFCCLLPRSLARTVQYCTLVFPRDACFFDHHSYSYSWFFYASTVGRLYVAAVQTQNINWETTIKSIQKSHFGKPP
jgi:hypothetical protein